MADQTTPEAIKKAADIMQNPNARIDDAVDAATAVAPAAAPAAAPPQDVAALEAAKAIDDALDLRRQKVQAAQAAAITDPNFMVQTPGEFTITSNHPLYNEFVQKGLVAPLSGSSVPGSYYKMFQDSGDKAPAALAQLISNPRDKMRMRARGTIDERVAQWQAEKAAVQQAQQTQAPAVQP